MWLPFKYLLERRVDLAVAGSLAPRTRTIRKRLRTRTMVAIGTTTRTRTERTGLRRTKIRIRTDTRRIGIRRDLKRIGIETGTERKRGNGRGTGIEGTVPKTEKTRRSTNTTDPALGTDIENDLSARHLL